MRASSLCVALTVLWAWSAVAARADDEGKLAKATDAIEEMLERLARVRPKPEGFVDPPQPATATESCRLAGTVRVGETPLADSLVTLLWVSKGVTVNSRVAPVATGIDGAFVFPRVPLGEYRMIGTAGDEIWGYATPVVVTSAGDRRLDVSLGSRKLAVTVLGQDLRPVPGARVEREEAWTLTPFVSRKLTDSEGRATIGFLADGLNTIRASIGDVVGSVRTYGRSGDEEIRMILPPFGSVEVQLKNWDADESVGRVELKCTRDGHAVALGGAIDASGHSLLRCSPGRWEFSLVVLGGAVAAPARVRTLEVAAGQTVAVDIPGE